MAENELIERLERLEREVTQLRDRDAIQRLQFIYGYYLDNRMWRQLADLFTENDPWMEIGRRGRYAGKEAIHDFLLNAMGKGRWGLEKDQIANHMQLQPVITLAEDGRTAQVRARAFIQMSHLPNKSRIRWAEGLYENLFVKEPDGWKIKHLWWSATFYAFLPVEGAYWHESVPEDDSVSAGQRSTGPDEALGRIWIPFHYPHPVTGEPVPSPAAASAMAETGGKGGAT